MRKLGLFDGCKINSVQACGQLVVGYAELTFKYIFIWENEYTLYSYLYMCLYLYTPSPLA